MKKMVVNVCCIFSCFLCGVNNGSTQVFADEVIDDTYKAKDFIGKGIDLSANHVIDTDNCVNYSIFIRGREVFSSQIEFSIENMVTDVDSSIGVE